MFFVRPGFQKTLPVWIHCRIISNWLQYHLDIAHRNTWCRGCSDKVSVIERFITDQLDAKALFQLRNSARPDCLHIRHPLFLDDRS